MKPYTLQNITWLTEDEAYALAKRLSQKSMSTRDRYDDYFDTYYKKWMHTEDWLYNTVLSLNGEIETLFKLICE